MHLDTELAQHHCARCKSKVTVPAVSNSNFDFTGDSRLLMEADFA